MHTRMHTHQPQKAAPQSRQELYTHVGTLGVASRRMAAGGSFTHNLPAAYTAADAPQRGPGPVALPASLGPLAERMKKWGHRAQ